MSEEIKLPSFIQVFALQPVQNVKSKKDGREFPVQKASCQFLDENGEQLQVGVMSVSSADIGKLKPGIYRPRFGMRIDYNSNEVKPILAGLDPMPSRTAPAAKG